MLVSINQLSKGMRRLFLILTLLIGVNIAFIFIQSALPPRIVNAEVEAVKEIVEEIFPSDGDVVEYTESNTDKLAHFIEFGTLGALVSTFIGLYTLKPPLMALASVGFVQFVAIIDETIQIFSGRCPDIVDLWLDILGFCSLSAIVYTVYFLSHFQKRKKEE